ncbi:MULTISPECIES: phosphotransferase family protein [Natrialbaceae]|uniref:phosphotransferase family protein n=1 Tax=Natrialbaceae TaxID=1644061 RepID=UPI001CFA38C8|nr:aminoglycoside phosphotransferase family protein [Natrinema amylolyticum]
MNENNTTDEDITAGLTYAFPEREIEAVRPAGLSWNDLNETVRVEFADGRSAFLKVARDDDGSRITRECAVIDYVDTCCDVDVPTVVASDATSEPPYLATAPMCERTLASQWEELSRTERTTVLRQVGGAIAEVHSQKFDHHGHIVDGDADGFVVDTGSWTTILVERIEMMRELASADRFEHYFDEVVEAVNTNHERLDLAPATLVHGDPAMPNICRSETTFGFIDWEIAHIGDPARELHKAQKRLLESVDRGDDEQLVRALHEGYRQRAGSLPAGLDDRAPIYDAVLFLGTAGYFDKVVDSSDDSPEEVARWIETEMTERLTAIQ